MSTDLICLNANDPQLPQVELFLRTLRDPNRGAFTGDVCVLTTGVSDATKRYLERQGVQVFENELSQLFDLAFWRSIAGYELYKRIPLPRTIMRLRWVLSESWHDRLKAYWIRIGSQLTAWRSLRNPDLDAELAQEFRVYRDKHFSKLNILHFLNGSDPQYDNVMLCDGDMIFQRPVQVLFALVEDNRIYVGEEVNSITPGTHIHGSNQEAQGSKIHQYLRYGEGAHELNVGFLLGRAHALLHRLIEWKRLMFESNLEWLFRTHPVYCWHEQDFMRLQRDMNPDHYCTLLPHHIVHTCNLGDGFIQETAPLVFQLREGGERPTVVHFCGGTWRSYTSVAAEYQRTVADVLAHLRQPLSELKSCK